MKGLAVLVAGFCMAGCAKFPDNTGPRSTRIICTLNVDGNIRTGTEVGGAGAPFVYIIAFRFSNQDTPTTSGPIPVIAPPWGNGFVAGNATHFVRWDPTAADEYLIYRFRDETTLTEWFPIGTPIVSEHVNTGAKRIRFEFDLQQLFPTALERDELRSVQVNFLTMDRVPQTGASKQWDALGDSSLITTLNDFVTIPLLQNGIFDNRRAGNLEPTNDQPNPDLDISDWTVEIQRQ